MYLEFFRFKEPPFKLSPDPRFFFFSEKHEEAFAHVLYGVKEGNGFISITGEVGTGKTTLCRLLLSKLEPSVRAALLFNTQLTTLELLQGINQEFGLKWRSRSKKVLLDELNRFLIDLASRGGQALLIIDEAQLLSVECLEELCLLSNLETERNKLIQILLIGQPELSAKLDLHELRQLKQRISLHCEIQALDRREVSAYIKSRVQVASGEDPVLFDPKGIDLIYQYSKGIPRLINIVADRALLAAFVASKEYVTATHVQQAIHDLEGEHEPVRPQGYEARIQEMKQWVMAHKNQVTWWGGGFVFFILILSAVLSWRSPESVKARPVEKGPSSVAMLRFDEAGIFRVPHVSETTRGAYLTLLNLWLPISSDPSWGSTGMEEMFNRMEKDRFQSHSVSLEIRKVLSLDYPMLFSVPKEGGAHYQVLAKVIGEEAVILDPLEGKRRIPLSEVTRMWQGKGVILWKEMEGVRLPLSMTGMDPSVKRIQEALQKEGLFLSPMNGIWTPALSRAVRFYQQREGLEENGLFGAETHLSLSKKVNRRRPSLQ